MKNKILLLLAFVAISFAGYSQSSIAASNTVSTNVSPISEVMLSLLKGIKMENIDQSWTSSAGTWMQNVSNATDAAKASKLMEEFSGAVSDNALQASFKTNKSKWVKQNAKVASMSAFKQSLKDFAAGINPSAFIPEFDLNAWNAQVDAL